MLRPFAALRTTTLLTEQPRCGLEWCNSIYRPCVKRDGTNTRPHFFFGGLITAVAGIVAKKFGPATGGLFLAFPAIFPASATLIEKHVKEKKERSGLHGSGRARGAAGVDAAGAAIGSVGLVAFAMLVSRFVPTHKPYLVLSGSALAWFVLAVSGWQLRRLRHRLSHRS
jgi:hypothetical protein